MTNVIKRAVKRMVVSPLANRLHLQGAYTLDAIELASDVSQANSIAIRNRVDQLEESMLHLTNALVDLTDMVSDLSASVSERTAVDSCIASGEMLSEDVSQDVQELDSKVDFLYEQVDNLASYL